MANANNVYIIGRLVKDPEIKLLQSNSLVANMTVATTRYFKNKDGERKEENLFIDCVAWNRQAEIVEKLCSKGQEVFISGRLELDQWESEHVCSKCQHQDKTRRSKHRIVVSALQYLGNLKKPPLNSNDGEVWDDDDDGRDDDYDDRAPTREESPRREGYKREGGRRREESRQRTRR